MRNPAKPPPLFPIKLGDHYTRTEFLELAADGAVDDDDGFAELATATQASRRTIRPSEAVTFRWPGWATHVVWYNQ